jgi:hypothetical protein
MFVNFKSSKDELRKIGSRLNFLPFLSGLGKVQLLRNSRESNILNLLKELSAIKKNLTSGIRNRMI